MLTLVREGERGWLEEVELNRLNFGFKGQIRDFCLKVADFGFDQIWYKYVLMNRDELIIFWVQKVKGLWSCAV